MRAWPAGFCCLAALLTAILGCGRENSPEPDAREPPPGWYHDVTAESGIATTSRNGEEAGRYAILE